jgi:hypothetical protein
MEPTDIQEATMAVPMTFSTITFWETEFQLVKTMIVPQRLSEELEL